MTLIQKLKYFFKKNQNLDQLSKNYKSVLRKNNLILFSFLVFFTIIFFSISSYNEQKTQDSRNNLKKITKSNEFSNLTNYLISKINSPYLEIKYKIKNNDSIEKILKSFSIKSEDIKNISNKLKQKKLSNIYAGRELRLVIKELEDNSKTVINLLFPISNTTSIEIRKSQDNFIVKENILKLNKKEVVIKNIITKNLYSSAIEANIEPNIIIEFARIFGFEVDFQRDIQKGDWFEIY